MHTYVIYVCSPTRQRLYGSAMISFTELYFSTKLKKILVFLERGLIIVQQTDLA